eukprot:scaffold6295_cov42-Phaeocystis_antarctica.AAC.2
MLPCHGQPGQAATVCIPGCNRMVQAATLFDHAAVRQQVRVLRDRGGTVACVGGAGGGLRRGDAA